MKGNRLEVNLPCTRKSLGRARSKAIAFALEHGFEREAEDIALATQEALKNILQHACPADNNMRMELTVTGDRLLIEVSDTGRGFDAEAVEGRDALPLSLHGRGIRIIRGLMDDLSIESDEEGTVISMEKKRALEGGPH